MKKLLVLLIGLFIFGECLLGCTNEAKNTDNPNNVKTADQEYSFLLVNKVDQNHPFPSSFEDNTWYCIVHKYRKLDGTVEENKDAYFCVYVENNNMWKYYCYPLYGKHGSNSTLANIVEHSNDVGYWCKIDINFYNAHKDKLPECVSKAPSEWSDLTEEQAYEFFYNKIAAYTWVDNDVPKTINGFQFIENKIFESENEIKWVIKFINGGNTETNNGVLLTKDKKNWYKI